MENKSVVHLMDKEHFNKVYQFALDNNLIREFVGGLDYLFNYGNANDQKTIVYLFPDIYANHLSFVANIYKIVPNKDYTDYEQRRLITIGMVWREDKQSWSFHS